MVIERANTTPVGHFVMVRVSFFFRTARPAIILIGRSGLNNAPLHKVPNCVKRAAWHSKTILTGCRRVKTSYCWYIQDSDLQYQLLLLSLRLVHGVSTWMSHASGPTSTSNLRRQKELLIVCRPRYRIRTGKWMLLGCLIKLMCKWRLGLTQRLRVCWVNIFAFTNGREPPGPGALSSYIYGLVQSGFLRTRCRCSRCCHYF